MFFIWGRRTYSRTLGYVVEYCSACKAVRPLKASSQTMMWHVFWIPLIPRGSLGLVGQCPECHHLYRLEAKDYTGFSTKPGADLAALTAETNPRLKASNTRKIPASRAEQIREAFLRCDMVLQQA